MSRDMNSKSLIAVEPPVSWQLGRMLSNLLLCSFHKQTEEQRRNESDDVTAEEKQKL